MVKRSEAGMITNPVTCGPDATVADVERLCSRYRISGVPVTGPGGVLLGIVTNRDIRLKPAHRRRAPEGRRPCRRGPGRAGGGATERLALPTPKRGGNLPRANPPGRL